MTHIEPIRSRAAYARLAVLSCGLFTVGTNAFVIAGLLPDIARSLNTDQGAVAFSITIYALVVAVASPAVSILLPRVPRTVLMAGGLLLLGTGTALAAFSDTLAVFTTGRVLSALGGAALVPTATAAAPALVPRSQHGKALAFVGMGFTIATAIGSPVGTALGDLANWRFPMALLGVLAVLLAGVVLVGVRHVPLSPSVSLRRRIGILREPRVVLSLLATAFLMMAFNVVYVFSAIVAARPTGGSGTLLSVLLLAFGLGGMIGNGLAGPMTDRLGSRTFGSIGFVVEVVALATVPLLSGSYVATLIAFGVWGTAAMAVNIPVQHRLVSIDPVHAGLAMSWYSTAMYVGIALAPLLGTATASLGGAVALPLAGAVVSLAGLAVFQLGYIRRSSSNRLLETTGHVEQIS